MLVAPPSSSNTLQRHFLQHSCQRVDHVTTRNYVYITYRTVIFHKVMSKKYDSDFLTLTLEFNHFDLLIIASYDPVLHQACPEKPAPASQLKWPEDRTDRNRFRWHETQRIQQVDLVPNLGFEAVATWHFWCSRSINS